MKTVNRFNQKDKASSYHRTFGDRFFTMLKLLFNSNITIGKNSLIGSNSVVTKNVPEKSVMAGIPAKRVGDATKGFKPYAVIDEEKV